MKLSTSNTDVRDARLKDLPFLMHLAKKWSYEIGFLPRIAFENRIRGIRSGGVMLARYNDQEAAFIHFGSPHRKECRIFQTATAMDLQRRHAGMNVVETMIAQVEAKGVQLVTCRCLESIDAVHFWQALGFKRMGYERGKRGLLSVWQYRTENWWKNILGGDVALLGHNRTHPCPQCGRPTTDTWTVGAKRWTTCAACTRARMAS